jgi:hypothetical protein
VRLAQLSAQLFALLWRHPLALLWRRPLALPVRPVVAPATPRLLAQIAAQLLAIVRAHPAARRLRQRGTPAQREPGDERPGDCPPHRRGGPRDVACRAFARIRLRNARAASILVHARILDSTGGAHSVVRGKPCNSR